MTTDAGYEILDHTADVAVRAHGPTPAAALRQAALGMFALIVPPERVRGMQTWEVEAAGDDPDLLLFNLLDELLYLHHRRRVVACDVDVDGVDRERPLRARARVRGEELDPARHRPGTEIKAVTLHAIGLRREGGRWLAHVVFDL